MRVYVAGIRNHSGPHLVANSIRNAIVNLLAYVSHSQKAGYPDSWAYSFIDGDPDFELLTLHLVVSDEEIYDLYVEAFDVDTGPNGLVDL